MRIIYIFLILVTFIYGNDNKNEIDDYFEKNINSGVKLETSVINSDYVEGEKLQGSKSIIIIDKKDIEGKGYSSVSDVLDSVPSVSVGRTGWGEIDIRGQGVDQATKNIQVMIDGAPITTLVNHPFQTNYDLVPIDEIERIEIIPGGGSVLYGNGSSGGVVNISTNLYKLNKPKTELGFEYFDTNKKRYFVNAGTKLNENLSVQLNYSKSQDDLYFVDTYRNSEYFSGGVHYRFDDKQNVSFKYSELTESGQFIKNISKNNLIRYGKDYKPSYTNITIGVDENGDRIRIRKRRYLLSDRKSKVFNGNYQFNLDKNLKIMMNGFIEKGHFTNNNDENKQMNQQTYGIKTKVDYKYSSFGSILIGSDNYTQKAKLTYYDYKRKKTSNGKYIKNKFNRFVYYADKLNFDYNRQVNALYFLNKFSINDTEFTQGVRRDVTTWRFKKDANDGNGSDKRESVNYAYELSSAYLYRDTGRVYARYERGFTGPDGIQISDRVYNSKGERVYKKTDADDEIFNIYEIGMRDKLFFSTVNITAFFTSTDNQLNRLYVENSKGKKEYRSLNLLATKRWGIETSFMQTIGKFTFEEGYSWLRGKTKYNSKGNRFIEEGNKIDWTDSGLMKVPEHNIVLKIGYDITQNLNLGVQYRYTGGYNNYLRESERSEDTLVKSNSLTDLSISYTKSDLGIVVYGGIKNVFNETYYSYVGDGFNSVIPADGRVFYAGLKYKL